MKKRDFFKIVVASVAGAVVVKAVQVLCKRLHEESEYEDEPEAGDDDALIAEDLELSYDEGFADGLNADYRGSNPAAQALQTEVEQILDECESCPYAEDPGEDEPDVVDDEETTEESEND